MNQTETDKENKTNMGKKIGLGLLGGCGLALLAFIVVTLCGVVAFPIMVLGSGSSTWNPRLR